MAISEMYSGSETVGTTEWDLVSDSSTLNAETADAVVQLVLDLSALAAGDVFEIKGYEKVVSAGTRRSFFSAQVANAQANPHWFSPSFILLHGYTFSLKKLAGTDRSITWSIRQVA